MLSISIALAKIVADSSNPRNNLTNGTYSSSTTGDNFPLITVDYVSLKGQSRDNVVIDANSQKGGGFFISFASPVFDSENLSDIFLNRASFGSDISLLETSLKADLDTFSVLNPGDYYTFPQESIELNILNAKIMRFGVAGVFTAGNLIRY